MSEELSARLALPLLVAGQSQKEWTHNEALTVLDLVVQPSITAIANAPPAAPQFGQCWIVGTAPTGDWSQQPRSIAGWTAGGWRFAAPVANMSAWVEGAGIARYSAGNWSVPAALPAPAGGSVVDIQARATLSAILSALRTAGIVST